MNIKPIKTEADYEAALTRIGDLMDAELNTPEGDELDVLTTLVEHYETKHHPISAPNPIEAIRFRMEQYGLQDKDLIPYLGRSGRVSEVLNYKRKLTLPMIRKLHKGLNIPTESLVQDYELKQA
ncbi:helix-turn-helix domain-containing protein [Neptuniibacter sp. PT34_22]|uniref:helix-turn-helix domain-containing protein n=1 Tax=Neptuniibacter sp. PT34_22 TaxID=3398205 RepID=UPI0039F4CA6B